MKHKLSALLVPLEEGGFMARCERIRATATGNTPEDALQNLQEAIFEMVKEYGEEEIFQVTVPGTDLRLIEVAV